MVSARVTTGLSRVVSSLGLPSAALTLLLGCAGAPTSDTDRAGADHGPEKLVPGSSFHGIHGLTVTADGRLLAGSVVGQAIYQVDPDSGAVSELVGPPDGIADDLEEGPGGELVWTSYLTGIVHARTGDGPVQVLAEGLPAVNSVAFDQRGRLFVTQVFGGDALWEIDPAGERPPRKIIEGMGGLNGFDFGPDGKLYGPLWYRQSVVRVDVDSGAMETVADGFGIPAAANFDSQGRLYVVDCERGEVVRVDTASGDKTVVAQLPPSLDNLAFSADDRLFVSNMAHNAVYEVKVSDGTVRKVVEGELAAPAGLALWQDDGHTELYLADTFAYRTIDGGTGAVHDVRTMFAQSEDELNYPVWASADEDHVLLTSWASSTVQVVDRRSGASLEMLHGFAAPTSAVELADGRIVVAELGSGHLMVVGATDRDDRQVLFDGLAGPVGMIRDGGDAVLVTESGTGSVVRYPLAGGEHEVVVSGLAGPEGLDLLPDGRIAVAEVGKRRLVAVTRDTGEIEVLAEDLPVGLPAPPGNPPAFVPTGVAAAADGTVYYTSDLENAIYRLHVSA